MSIYSESLNANSLSSHLENQSIPYKPKYMRQDSNLQRNSVPDHQQNKLPLNLFLTPAQYNKMLVTYGKNRKKPTSHISDGFLTNLQFVNDHIFQKINQERAIGRLSVQNQLKSSKKRIDPCTCCCCEEFCQQCSNQRQNCNKMSSTDIKKAVSQIDQQILLARKGSRMSINSSNKKSKYQNRAHQSRRSQSAFSDIQKNKQNKAQQSYLNHSQSQKGADISHLVIKSLIEFQQNKMKEAFLKKEKYDNEKAKQQYLHLLNSKIRSDNLKASRLSCSVTKSKSPSKSQVSKEYWNQVKQDVMKNLKNDNYSATLKKQLMKADFNVFQHKDLPKKKSKLTKEQIQLLRKKHEQQVKKQMDQEIKEKQQKAQRIRDNLKSLEKQRIDHIQSIPHKPFRPTQEMIDSAFKNIIEPKQVIEKDIKQKNNSRRQTIKKQNSKKL